MPMTIRKLMEIAATLPPDAVIIPNSDPPSSTLSKGMLRPGAHTAAEGAVIAGFTAEELKQEDCDLVFYEDSGLVVLQLIARAIDGKEVY